MNRIATMALCLLGIGCATGHAGRVGLLNPPPTSEEGILAAESTDEGSPFSFGTLLGLSYALHDSATYKVRNGVVLQDSSDNFSSRLQPGVFALPSLTLIGKNGHSLSAILPFGIQDKSGAGGIGLSWGFAVRKGLEIGLASAVVWSTTPTLNNAQTTSFRTGAALPQGESDQIGSSLQPSFGFGIYVAPIIK